MLISDAQSSRCVIVLWRYVPLCRSEDTVV